MSRLLQRLGGTVHRHRLAVIVLWVATLVGAVAAAGALSQPMSNSFEIPGQESTEAFEILGERFDTSTGDEASATVVIRAEDGAELKGPATEEAIASLLDNLRDVDGTTDVTDPLDSEAPVISEDLTTASSTVTFDKSPLEIKPETQDELREAASDARSDGLLVDLTGSAVLDTEGSHGAELIGIVIALIVLTVTFGALIVAGMNLLTALIGVGVGLMGITAATGFVELQSTTPALALMLGLAVGIDYALFIVSRFRAELREGSQVGSAVATAVGTAGSAVVVAGLTVVIALAGLFVVGIPFLTEMGLAAAFTVVIAVLVSITLTPAVLSYLGRRALPRRERKAYLAVSRGEGPPAPDRSESLDKPGLYARWIGAVTRRPLVAMVLTGAFLLTLSVPLLSMKTNLEAEPAPGTTQARAAEALADAFGEGSQGAITLLLDGQPAVDSADELRKRIEPIDAVADVTAPVPNDDGSAATLTVIPAEGPAAEATEQLVTELRDLADEVAPQADIYVTGRTAVGIDVTQSLRDALPMYLGLVVGLAFILLVMVFRSLLVPFIGVLGFLLTIGSALGATVAVFQWGWLAGPLGIEVEGPLGSLTPILMVGILFGLAMDYQIFLVSRMHEAHAQGRSAVTAIREGFRHAAPVVVAAALIMFAIFAGFFPGGDATLKSIAFSLSAGIAVDALVVRMMFVPAAMALAGDRAWGLPSWLRWLPHLDVEGTNLSSATPDRPNRVDAVR